MTRGKHRPETVLSAAAKRSQHLQILSVHGSSGVPLSAREMADLNGWTEEVNGCYWKRQSELRDMFLLETVEKHKSPKGPWVKADVITDEGREFLKYRGSMKK